MRRERGSVVAVLPAGSREFNREAIHYASGFLPEVWLPDPKTLALRREVTRREQIMRQRVRLQTFSKAPTPDMHTTASTMSRLCVTARVSPPPSPR
jgi:hypothetical protein